MNDVYAAIAAKQINLNDHSGNSMLELYVILPYKGEVENTLRHNNLFLSLASSAC